MHDDLESSAPGPFQTRAHLRDESKTRPPPIFVLRCELMLSLTHDSLNLWPFA